MRRGVLGALLLLLEEHLGASSLLKMLSHLLLVQLTQLTQEHALHQMTAKTVGLKELTRMAVRAEDVSGVRLEEMMELQKPASLGALSGKQQPLLHQLHHPVAQLMKTIGSAVTPELLLKAAKQSAAAGAHPSPDMPGALTCPRLQLQKEALAQLRLFHQLPRPLPPSRLQRSQLAVLTSA